MLKKLTDAVAAPGAAIQLRDSLRDRIVRCELKPQTRLSEAEIAAQSDVSRQPVREAFIMLAGEGLLTALPQRGTFVTRISMISVLNARFVREAVECALVRRIAHIRSDCDLEQIERALDAQRAHQDDPARFIALDERFHAAISEGCGHGDLWSAMPALKTHLDRLRFLHLGREASTATVIREHGEILAAIEARDADAAEAAMRGHLDRLFDDLPGIARDYPDYFAEPQRLAELTTNDNE